MIKLIADSTCDLSAELLEKYHISLAPLTITINGVDNKELIKINAAIRNHPVEEIGQYLRASMTAMTKIV